MDKEEGKNDNNGGGEECKCTEVNNLNRCYSSNTRWSSWWTSKKLKRSVRIKMSPSNKMQVI